MKSLRTVFFIVAVFVIMAVLVYCSKNRKSVDNGARIRVDEELGAQEIEAFVMFLIGEVYSVNSNSEKIPLEIGDSIMPGERIVTGPDGYAELEIGNLGSVHVDSSTDYTLENLTQSEGSIQASGALTIGSAFAKVKKLTGNDAFEVKVPGAVCAVRGTNFLVSMGADNKITVAVDEGSVYVIPPALSAAGKDIRVNRIENVLSAMPVITASEEAVFQSGLYSDIDTVLPDDMDSLMDNISARLQAEPINITPLSQTNRDIIRAISTSAAAKEKRDSDDLTGNQPAASTVSKTQGNRTPPSTSEEISFALDSQEKVSVTVITIPETAAIGIDGKSYGTGRIRFNDAAGEHHELQATADGFYTLNELIAVYPDKPVITLELKPRTEINRFRLPGQSTGTITENGRYAVVASKNGLLTAFTRNGKVVWQGKSIGERAEDNISPAIIGGNIYTVGNGELFIHELRSGTLIHKEPKNVAGQPVRRAVGIDNNRIAIPVAQGLEIVNNSGKTVEKIDIPGGAATIPVIWKDKMLVMNRQGELLVINSGSLAIENSIQTKSVNSRGYAPAVAANLAFFSGNGIVSAVNLGSGSIAWERSLTKDKKIEVSADIISRKDAVYIYGNGKLFVLNANNGKDKYQLEGISPPMVKDDFIYLSQNKDRLGVFSVKNGEEEGSIYIGEKVITPPISLSSFIAVVGGETVVVTDARSITDY